MKKWIAKRIKYIRIKQGLTQEGLAWKAEIDRTFMNHIESGQRNISIDTLDKLIQTLGYTWKEFFANEDAY